MDYFSKMPCFTADQFGRKNMTTGDAILEITNYN